MKKTKFLFVLAILFAGISFTSKAQTVADVSVWLMFSTNNNNVFNQTGFDVTMINNETSEYYYLETKPGRMIDGSTYDIGDVPAGNYTIYIGLKPSYNYSTLYCDWYSVGSEGNYLNFTTFGQYDTLVSSSVEVDGSSFEMRMSH